MNHKPRIKKVAVLLLAILVAISILLPTISSAFIIDALVIDSAIKDKFTTTPPGWTEDIRLSYTGNDARYPSIAYEGDYVHVVWANYTAPYDIFYQRSTNKGRTWEPERIISNTTTSGGVGMTTIAVNGSTIHVVWDDDVPTGRFETFYTRSTDNGLTWSESIQLTEDNNTDSYDPSIACWGDNVYVVWADERNGQYDIYFKKSSDSGQTWSIDKRLTTSPDTETSNCIAVNNTNIHIAYNRRTGTPSVWEVYYINSIDGGISWNPPLMISQDNDAHSVLTPRGSISVNGSSVHIVWDERKNLDGGEIYYRKSTDGGSLWELEVRLINDPNRQGSPVISTEGNKINVVFGDNRIKGDYLGDVWFINSTDAGVTWNSEYQLTYEPFPVSSGAAKIAMQDNYLYVVFLDNRTTPSISLFDIYYKRFPDFPADTTPPTINHTPATSVHYSQPINITAKVSDNVAISSVWLNYTDVNGTNYNVSMNGWNQKLVMVSGLGPTLYAQNGNYSYEIPAQGWPGALNYFIWIDDTEGNLNMTSNYQVNVYDNTMPKICPSSIGSANVGNLINLTATVTDDIAVDLVYLNYTDVNGMNYNVSMAKWNGNWSFDIPGQNTTGVVEYFIWASDTSGNANMTMNYTIQIYDITAPVITHNPPPPTPVNTPINIVANVTDDVGVSNVTLYYANVDDTDYTAVDMAIVSGNWSYEIPAQTKTGFVHYLIRANDTSGNNATSPTMGTHTIQITGLPSITVSEPGGGEIWTSGSNHWIEFIASDTEDAPAALDVFLNYTSATAGNDFIAQIKGDGSPYNWTLPTINATDVRIIATVIDTDGNKAFAESPLFTIDSSMPEIISTNPGNNSTGISLSQPIIIQFNEPMNISSVVVNQTNGTNPGGWQWFWNPEKGTLTGIHDAWPRGETIEITVHAGYMDASDPGNVNNTAYVFMFTTEINPPPEIIHANVTGPIELGDSVRINATITDDGTVMNAVLWWRDVDGVWHGNYMQKTGDEWFYIVPGQIAEGRVRYQINATDNLGQKNTTAIYEFDIVDTVAPVIAHTPVVNAIVNEPINITCLVADLGGVGAVYLHYRNESEANFTQVTMSPSYWYELAARSEPRTIEYYIRAVDAYGNEASTGIYSLKIIDPAIPDTTPPEVLFVGPTGNDIPIRTSISIVFSEAMDRASVEGAIMVSPGLTGITYTWVNDQTLMLSFDALQHNTTYTVTVGVGARDLAGNNLASAYSGDFSTVEESEIVEPPTPNDWGWIGIIIFLVAVIALLLLYLFNKGKKEPDNIEEEQIAKERGPPDA